MRHVTRIFAIALALAGAFVAGCDGNTPRSGPLETPVFVELQTPSTAGGWITATSLTPAPAVLPTRNRGVRVGFTAPVGSTFTVSLRTPDGTATPLPENKGTPAPAEAGYFQIMSVDTNKSPPVYLMYVRAPITLTDPANYAIEIVNQSLRTDVTDSAPLVVGLGQRPIFTVTVKVVGSGHVTSNPAGIQCGSTSFGSPLTDCSFDFPPGPVSLIPGSNTNAKFIGWSGNCAPNVQVCTFALTGQSATNATATFGPSNTTVTPSTCPPAPLLPGLRWIDLPDCATGNIAEHPGISHPALCDAQGYFCCEPGPTGANAPRCGGLGKIESPPDCRQHAPKGMLRQPGGCYEVDSP